MKSKFWHRALCAVGLAAAMVAPSMASVTTVDFEGAGLTGLYFPGDSFSQNGFKMTVDFDAGIVGDDIAPGPNAPTGNASQFYSQLNDGGLIIERSDGGLFDLLGFDAAFIPLSPAAAGTTVIVAVTGSSGVAWNFLGSSTSRFPFGRYDDPADFASFSQVRRIDFFACVLDNAGVCATATRNNGQFAIDNIRLGVPEPGSLALVALSLLGLAATRRRSAC